MKQPAATAAAAATAATAATAEPPTHYNHGDSTVQHTVKTK